VKEFWCGSRPCSRAKAGRRGPGGFSLAEVLVAVSLTAILAIPLARIMNGSLNTAQAGEERVRLVGLYADLLDRISEDLRQSTEAKRWKSSGLEIDMPGKAVRYGASKSGIYRTSKEGAGSWKPDPDTPLIEWDDPGDLDVDVEGTGLVVIRLSGDGVSLQTAVLPRGGEGATGWFPGGGKGGKGGSK